MFHHHLPPEQPTYPTMGLVLRVQWVAMTLGQALSAWQSARKGVLIHHQGLIRGAALRVILPKHTAKVETNTSPRVSAQAWERV